ncbi:hypothetical protein, partial [Clostridium sp.]|uniref:hypothetical protein n=1 Tax=Clostridium sp. TaxID=1506 RepID=UPI003464A1B5
IENFVEFLREGFVRNPYVLNLNKLFDKDKASIIEEDLLKTIALSFNIIKSIDIIYDENIEKINEALSKVIELIIEDNNNYEEYVEYKDIYIYLLHLKIISILRYKIDTKHLEELILNINKIHMKDDLNDNLLKYLDHMNLLSKIKPQDILSLLNHGHFTLD